MEPLGTAAKHQSELNDYLQSKNISQLFVQIVESLLIEKPDEPIRFIINLLEKQEKAKLPSSAAQDAETRPSPT